ncbi:MAG: hypothetical protein QOJ99_4803 [Bryobacterales bacterium]|nr:hypothetical protein [Bryobacterales bacterium]
MFITHTHNCTSHTRRGPGEGVKKSPWRVFERSAEELKRTGVILDKGACSHLLKTQVELRASEEIRHREDAAGCPRVPKRLLDGPGSIRCNPHTFDGSWMCDGPICSSGAGQASHRQLSL